MPGFIAAVPFSMAIGAPISTLPLDVAWFDLKGWQWLFILERLPAVVPRRIYPPWLGDRGDRILSHRQVVEDETGVEREFAHHERVSETT